MATVQEILSWYESDSPGTIANIRKFFTHGALSNTGKTLIYAVDQGFEHGPGRSFGINPDSYDPHYHFQFAIDSGASGFAAPLGFLESGARTFAGQIPLILKMNSSNSLLAGDLAPDQAITASIEDALRLGCSAIGFTIYPGSDASLDMFEEIRELAEEAKAVGLAVVIWSYARGNMSKEGETALDIISYGAHMAALLGAHIIKVKVPTACLENPDAKAEYIAQSIPTEPLTARIQHVMKCAFGGRRIVIFSGGTAKDNGSLIEESQAIRDGGGLGSIIGRNFFRRPRQEALTLVQEICRIYQK